MSFLRRALRFLFPATLQRLLHEANEHGRVTLAEIETETGWGWYATIRPERSRMPDARAHRYQWTGQGATMISALQDAVDEANDSPEMRNILGASHRPQLGGKEYDE